MNWRNGLNNRKERLHTQAVEYYRAGTSQRWRACLAAYRIVGSYQKGETSSLAYDLRISVSQVENLARAGLTYVQLRPTCQDLPDYRRVLTYSHFAVLGDLIRKYDIPLTEAIEQIRTAAEEGASVEQMRSALEGEYNPDGHKTWQDKLRVMRKGCEYIMAEDDTPPDVFELCADFYNQSDGYFD